jgi:lycopene cyclase domain-containing protein
MSYWALNAIFLAVVACLAVASVLARRSARWRAIAVTGVLVLLLTAVFDNVMISLGLFGYNPANISGAFVGLAPLEDFSYAIAAVVLLPTLWHLLGKREGNHD